MYIEQLYTGCLAEAAYYIESEGQAAIIDPLRETKPYTDKTAERGTEIKYVLETHFHADFVSGHIDLARKTGAQIVFGPTAKPNYSAHVAEDGEILPLGKISIKVLHTPGHTMESTTYLLIDETGKEHAIFTGDTLFIGDVGRPDLAVKGDITDEVLAGYLYKSLRTKIMPLADEVIVYPGHGAGSACGKMMSKDTVDTLGHQKQFNYALRADMTQEEFVKEVLTGLVAPPQYFPKNAVLNRTGYGNVEDVIDRGTVALEIDEFELLANDSRTLIIDVRHKDLFKQGFIPGSVFIGLEDNFAPWAGTLIPDLMQAILLVGENEGKIQEAVIRLARVGYDNTLGYLKGGVDSWKAAGKKLEVIQEVDAAEFARLYHENPDIPLVDVRRASEYNAQHVLNAQNVALDFIYKEKYRLDEHTPYYVHCAGGYRSMIAVSLLQREGFRHLTNISGGFKALSTVGLPTTEFAAPITEL